MRLPGAAVITRASLRPQPVTEHSRSLTRPANEGDVMTTSSTSVVHFFDTIRHAVPCGAPGFAERSTKHSHGVTCPRCVELLRARPAPGHATAADDAHAW
jgi:hypothetical protein